MSLWIVSFGKSPWRLGPDCVTTGNINMEKDKIRKNKLCLEMGTALPVNQQLEGCFGLGNAENGTDGENNWGKINNKEHSPEENFLLRVLDERQEGGKISQVWHHPPLKQGEKGDAPNYFLETALCLLLSL